MQGPASETWFKGNCERVTGCVAINYRGWRVAAEQKGIFNYLSVNDIIGRKKSGFGLKKEEEEEEAEKLRAADFRWYGPVAREINIFKKHLAHGKCLFIYIAHCVPDKSPDGHNLPAQQSLDLPVCSSVKKADSSAPQDNGRPPREMQVGNFWR